MSHDRVPTDGEHRGVPLHAGQSEARLVIVRRDIDAAHEIVGVTELVAFADDPRNAPEARLLASALALATLDEATDRRDPRNRAPVFSRQRIKASVAGLSSVRWQASTHFCSSLDALRNRAARREA